MDWEGEGKVFQQSAEHDLASAELKMTLAITLTLGDLDFIFPRVPDRDAWTCCLGEGYVGTQRTGEGTGHYCKKSLLPREKATLLTAVINSLLRPVNSGLRMGGWGHSSLFS